MILLRTFFVRKIPSQSKKKKKKRVCNPPSPFFLTFYQVMFLPNILLTSMSWQDANFQSSPVCGFEFILSMMAIVDPYLVSSYLFCFWPKFLFYLFLAKIIPNFWVLKNSKNMPFWYFCQISWFRKLSKMAS